MISNRSLSWSTTTPGHIVFLIDLSESMGWDNGARINLVMSSLYQCLDEVLERSKKGGEYLPRFTYSIIGYNSDIIDISHGGVDDLMRFLNEADERGNLFDIKGKAKPQWQTYMAAAFNAAKRDVESWISKQKKHNIPTPIPIVINITDGHPEESGKTSEQAMSEAETAALELKKISTFEGPLLLFNIHIDPKKSYKEVLFPDSLDSCPDDNSRFLFRISSYIPEESVAAAKVIMGIQSLSNKCKVLLSNTNNALLVTKFITFGTTIPINKEHPKTT